ncbi:myogenesis-regulating glycosidase-like [Euwallacea similis]|uniref:myogenesis-regulating glycosidase-like n=1 Tax=Euwallacea similis TaxID=1736056 RepID=UPI00344E308E
MAKLVYFGSLLLLVFLNTASAGLVEDTTGRVSLSYERTSDGLNIQISRDGKSQLKGVIGKGRDFQSLSCAGDTHCRLSANEELSIVPMDTGYNVTWVSEDIDHTFNSCFFLEAETTNWYGGPERHNQLWPIEKMNISGSEPYVIKKNDNFAVAERYWLNSKGTYIWLSDHNPLWVEQDGNTVCYISNANSDPYVNRWRTVLTYVVYSFDDPKAAHLDAVSKYLGKPEKHPGDKMIEKPVWTTWAKYKKSIDDGVILEFAENIRNQGYEGGQLEIDDYWERCYGSQEFDETKFGNFTETIKKLHEDDWRVSIWIHPFVNDDCQNVSDVGKDSGYFVRNGANETHAVWWDGDDAHQIDFTNPEAAKWWSDRLQNLKDTYGLDSFKFDAGEIDYANQPAIYEDVESTPNILTQKYIETCVAFGDLIEVRSSFRTQRYGEFVRMIDKDSNWGLNNGLASLVTTLLQLNINGYVMVLPDMIGGNGYGDQPTGELIVRWTQANTFMPSMQFSYLPWDYEDDIAGITDIVKKYIDLHEQYAPNILKAMDKSIEDGTPVNAPIWWIDPTDATALANNNEYLLGEEILVAPILEEGATTRDVYLPKGDWQDGNDGKVYTGPTTLKDYPAPIELLPYFIKQ